MWPRHSYLEEAAGGDDGKGGGGDGDKGKGGDGKGSESNELLMRGLAVVAKGIGDMQEGQKQLLEHLRTMSEKRGSRDDDDGDRGSGNGSDKSFSDVDLEQLDRKELVALVLTKFEDRLQHHLKDVLKPVNERMDGLTSKVDEDLATREVKAAQEGRPDLMEWRAEISALIKETPNLNVTRAYAIVRSENPDKAKKMDEKYSKQGKPTGTVFDGLVPSSGGGRGEGATKMKFSEAAEKAWSDVVSQLGGVSVDNLPVVGGR